MKFILFFSFIFSLSITGHCQYFNNLYYDRPCEVPESKQSMIVDRNQDIVFLSLHPDFSDAFVVNKVDIGGTSINSRRISTEGGRLYATSIIATNDEGYIITGGYKGHTPYNWDINAPYDYLTFYMKLDINLNTQWFKLNYSSHPLASSGLSTDSIPNSKIGIGITQVDHVSNNYIILTKGYDRDIRNTFLSTILIDDNGNLYNEKLFCPNNNSSTTKLMNVHPNSIKALNSGNINVIGGTISDSNTNDKVFLFSVDNNFNVLNNFTVYDLDYNYTDLPSNVIEGTSDSGKNYLYYSFRIFTYTTLHPPLPFDTFRNALLAIDKNDFTKIGYTPTGPTCYVFGTIGNYVNGRYYNVKSQTFLSQPDSGIFNISFSGHFFDSFDHSYRTNPTFLQFNEWNKGLSVHRYNSQDEPGNLLQCEVLCNSNQDIVKQVVDVNSSSSRLISSNGVGDTHCRIIDSMKYASFSVGQIQYQTYAFSSQRLDFEPDVENVELEMENSRCTADPLSYRIANEKQEENKSSIITYPNPVDDYLWVSAPVGSQLSLFSVDSKLILSQITKSEKTSISFMNLPNGIYFLKVFNNSILFYEKIIK